jgi:hypothetical protein
VSGPQRAEGGADAVRAAGAVLGAAAGPGGGVKGGGALGGHLLHQGGVHFGSSSTVNLHDRRYG